ncbi:hypothetical protein DYBT9275_04445 [Dyadobacter sp. CECT 9275]|uniref:Peptidase M10 metallopeptidase domain-containing protein n=1 Tax=Dyadobacter helix TaxID=2822344 RepID=A0A916N7K2_9BACT|nr:matrixin family metalloprotease [Dyadobacter sp. CECT 9275]CAG5009205.1 hypothetical protein DYBT9275_04445 [Dyadobacter sp. CECT 9275]
MKNFFLFFSTALFVWACSTVPDPASKVYYITETTTTRQPSGICAFRYKITNSYSRLDNQSQQNAVRAAFDLWQKGNPNLLFLQKQDGLTTEIAIRFAEPSEIPQGTQKAPIGLVRGNIPTISALKVDNNNYTILLDASFPWDTHAITRALSFHIGKFLGLEISPENGSMMNPVYLKETIRLSDADSVKINALYSLPCTSGCNNFLPLSLPVNDIITKSIRLDKQGKIAISASGRMVIGFWLGWSTPAGLENGLFSVPIGDYSLDRSINHAALIYRINNETKWRYCGTACEFSTDGVSQCIDVTLAINDNKPSDNDGAYDVTVNYKP